MRPIRSGANGSKNARSGTYSPNGTGCRLSYVCTAPSPAFHSSDELKYSSPRAVTALTISGASIRSDRASRTAAVEAFAVGSESMPPSGQSSTSMSSPSSGAVASSCACSTALGVVRSSK